MTDLRHLSRAVDLATERGLPWCLVTLFATEGSSYRRPGACMVVVADGSRAGAISGGCVEGEVAEYALRTIEQGVPVSIVLNDDLDPEHEGFGTGCGGRLHVLLEPVRSGRGPLADLTHLASSREPFVHALVVCTDDRQTLAWRFADPTDASRFELADLPRAIASRIANEARAARIEGHTGTLGIEEDGHRYHALLEYVQPRIRLVVVGDGHDVGPVVRIATTLDWETVVVGRRSVPELKSLFPDADDVHFAMHANDSLDGVGIDTGTAVVAASHNFDRDRATLRQAIESPAFYVGVLGPRSRTDRMAVQFDPRVHAPLGLDVGAETPAEIALALVAEIQATRSNTVGGRLRDHSGPIHRPVAARTVRELREELET